MGNQRFSSIVMEKNMKRLFFALVLALVAGSFSFAQSADKVTQILEADEITYGQLGYLSACQLSLVDDSTSFVEAFTALQNAGYVGKDVSAGDKVTYKGLSGLCSRTFGIRESLMYRITSADRYAFKQLQSLGAVPSSADPGRTVSGYDAMSVISECIELTGQSAASEGDE